MKWFNSLKVSTRFLVIAIFIVPFLIGLGGTGLWGINQINNLAEHTREQDLPSAYTLGDFTEQLQSIRIDHFQALLETDPDKIEEYITQAKAGEASALKDWQAYKQFADEDAQDLTLWAKFDPLWERFVAENAQVQEQATLATPQARAKGLEVLTQGSGNELNELISKLGEVNYEGREEEAKASQNTFNLVITLVTLSAIGSIVGLGLAGTVLARSIIGMTNHLARLNGQVTEAYSTIEDKRHYGEEISQRLRAMTGELNATSTQQASGSQQQASSITQVSGGLSELSTTAQLIATRSEEINSMAGDIFRSTDAVRTTTVRATKLGKQGQQAMTETITTNQKVSQVNGEMVDNLLELQKRSNELKEINHLMREISDETHLLSLNAAIEAAGAGEYGERFAVVAQAVKVLADRSLSASRDVSVILGNLQDRIAQAVRNAEENQAETEAAVAVAEEAGSILGELLKVIELSAEEVEKIKQALAAMTSLTQEIKLSTGEQHSASTQIAGILQQIVVIAQQNASGSTRVNTTVGELEELSHELNTVLAA